VAAAGSDFVEWSWSAVEGATGYEVQLSLDEMFTDDDPIVAVEGTSFRTPETTALSPGASAYLRVRAVSGAGAGDWSTHVTGMTTASGAPNVRVTGRTHELARIHT